MTTDGHMDVVVRRHSRSHDSGLPLHALMFPFPVHSHIHPMLHLAKLLIAQDFLVSFVNTEHTHALMRCNAPDIFDFGWDRCSSRLRFLQIADGLPEGHRRFEEDPVETAAAVTNMALQLLRLLGRTDLFGENRPRTGGDSAWPFPTCIIADSFLSWVQDVADRFGIARVALWTTPIHANLAYIAHKPDENFTAMTTLTAVSSIAGVPECSPDDEISFFQLHPHHFLYKYFQLFSMKRAEEAAWNVGNNLSEMEEACKAFKMEVPNFLPVGPLFDWPLYISAGKSVTVDEEYMRWLDGKETGGVLYVSFGSFVAVEEAKMEALALAVEDSGATFLWAGRIHGLAAQTVVDRMVAKGQGIKVAWVAQLRVLAHPAVGAFLSHCGWNSVLESASMGVPLIACPIAAFAEQRLNAHFIARVWGIGLRLPSKSAPSSPPSQVSFDPSLLSALIRRFLGHRTAAASCKGSADAEVDAVRSRVSALCRLLCASSSSAANLRLFVSDMRHRAARLM